MATMRIVSPERRWRAAAAPVLACLLGWAIAGSVQLRSWPPAGLPLAARLVIICAAAAIGLAAAVLIMRTHLDVTDDGLADHRMLKVVRVPWRLVADFEVRRPGGLWGGYCVTAVCHDKSTIDLMSTRAYSRVPSGQHLDELHRICWSLHEAARSQIG